MADAQRDPMNLNRLVYFAMVVEQGSFTRAAERLGVTKAVVSQQVARLEEELGVSLLLRTTRSVTPTEAGRLLHARCVVILRESAEVFEELTQGTAEPRGKLRVTAPFDYGVSVVVPVVTKFTARYSECEVELSLTDRLVDMQTVDVAIRVGWLRDSSHQARKIGTMEQFLVCSRDFPFQHLCEPRDLESCPAIRITSLPEPDTWTLSHRELGRRTVQVNARLSVDATPAAHAAALAGGGLVVLPDYVVREDLCAGRLVRLFPEWELRRGGIHVVLPTVRFRPAKVRCFLEMIRDHVEEEQSSRSGRKRPPRKRSLFD